MTLVLLLLAAPALAHGPNQPPHQLYRIGDFKLESGEVVKDFAISYVTHGTLNAKKSNAVLMVTAISPTWSSSTARSGCSWMFVTDRGKKLD